MALEAKQISFRYGRRHPWVLDNCSLTVERGERLAIVAPSGYGKTTLALLLSGSLKPEKGRILLDGQPLPKKGLCPVQLIRQHPEKAIDPRWRMKQVLEESGLGYDELPEGLGIAQEWLERFPGELSGGELQRFCAARALLSGADFLICDEISTMLDAVTQAQIWKVIQNEADKRNMGILIITHNEHLAQRIASRTISLSAPF